MQHIQPKNLLQLSDLNYSSLPAHSKSSSHVSLSSIHKTHILPQAPPTCLTREQRYVADRMVEAHRLFRSQDVGHHRVSGRLQL